MPNHAPDVRNVGRGGASDGYTIKRTWDYFVEHLRGATPPWDFKVEVRPIHPQ